MHCVRPLGRMHTIIVVHGCKTLLCSCSLYTRIAVINELFAGIIPYLFMMGRFE